MPYFEFSMRKNGSKDSHLVIENIRFSIKHNSIVYLMTSIAFNKICENKTTGALYNVFYNKAGNMKTPIFIKIPYTKSIFGIESRYNNKFFKWNVSYDDINNIQLIENNLKNSFIEHDLSEIKSKIIVKKNYPTMIDTKLNKNSSSNTFNVYQLTKSVL